MNIRIGRLAALALLVSPAAASGGETPPPDLELASLAVTDGIVGGFVGPRPHVLLAAGYDRVERGFRAVRRRQGAEGEEVWVAELEPEQFRALLELVVASGLPSLPLENPPACTDVYGRNRQVRLDYRDVRWANGAPDGCVQPPSAVVPDDAQRARFDEVVARLERAVDAFPLHRTSAAALRRVPYVRDVNALATYRRVMEHVLADPVVQRIDLERLWVGENRVSFSWRGKGPAPPGGGVDFVIDSSGAVRRAPSAPTSDAVRFVPVETGMTAAEVEAALGPPDAREERADGSLVWTYSTVRPPAQATLTELLPARLRFENGRLSAP